MSEVLDLLKEWFFDVIAWIFDFFFVDCFGLIKSLGSNIYNSLSSKISDSLFSFDSLIFILGFLCFAFLAKIVISIIRG